MRSGDLNSPGPTKQNLEMKLVTPKGQQQLNLIALFKAIVGANDFVLCNMHIICDVLYVHCTQKERCFNKPPITNHRIGHCHPNHFNKSISFSPFSEL